MEIDRKMWNRAEKMEQCIGEKRNEEKCRKNKESSRKKRNRTEIMWKRAEKMLRKVE